MAQPKLERGLAPAPRFGVPTRAPSGPFGARRPRTPKIFLWHLNPLTRLPTEYQPQPSPNGREIGPQS